MQFPNLSFVEFAILGVLLDGEVPGETLRRILSQEFDWKNEERQFFIRIGRLKRFKLIEIHKDVTTTERRTRQESCYTISDAGRAQWKYAYSFFRSLCDRWKDQADFLPTIEVPPVRIASEIKQRRLARLPNAEEVALILKKAPPEFAVIFKLALTSTHCIVALSAVDVSDFEKKTWTLRLSNLGSNADDKHHVVIPESCRQAVSAAIAGRSFGPLFLTGKGVPWREENLRMCWRRLRSKLNLAKGVVMPSVRFLEDAHVMRSGRAEVAD